MEPTRLQALGRATFRLLTMRGTAVTTASACGLVLRRHRAACCRNSAPATGSAVARLSGRQSSMRPARPFQRRDVHFAAAGYRVFNPLLSLTGVRRHLGGAARRPTRPGARAGDLGRHLPGAPAHRHPARRRRAACDPHRRHRRRVRLAAGTLDATFHPGTVSQTVCQSIFCQPHLCHGPQSGLNDRVGILRGTCAHSCHSAVSFYTLR